MALESQSYSALNSGTSLGKRLLGIGFGIALVAGGVYALLNLPAATAATAKLAAGAAATTPAVATYPLPAAA